MNKGVRVVASGDTRHGRLPLVVSPTAHLHLNPLFAYVVYYNPNSVGV